MNTNISKVIDQTSDAAQYDDSIKEMLADKQVLARILKYTLDEFKDYTIEKIIECISEPEVGSIRVDSGMSKPEKVCQTNTEDNVKGEGKIFFDIRFNVYYGDELIKLLINIEAQKSTTVSKLRYHLDNRIIYYLARMISSQKEVEFSKSNYDAIKAVKSIWICMDGKEDSINRFSFKQDTIYGNDIELENIDKVQGIIICLRNNPEVATSKNKLIAMLEELLKSEPAKEKKQKLSDEYGFIMTTDTERRVNYMCNLSESLAERVLEEGIQKGIQKGMQQGIQQGLAALVTTIKTFVGDDFEKVKEAVIRNEQYANVSDEDIKKYM